MAPKTIEVLTSGGDAPGMNAAIPAVTRAALYQGWQVFDMRHGYTGLIEGNFELFSARSVGGSFSKAAPCSAAPAAPSS